MIFKLDGPRSPLKGSSEFLHRNSKTFYKIIILSCPKFQLSQFIRSKLEESRSKIDLEKTDSGRRPSWARGESALEKKNPIGCFIFRRKDIVKKSNKLEQIEKTYGIMIVQIPQINLNANISKWHARKFSRPFYSCLFSWVYNFPSLKLETIHFLIEKYLFYNTPTYLMFCKPLPQLYIIRVHRV